MFKNSTFFGAWSFLLVHMWFTPSEGSKGCVNRFPKKSQTMEVGPQSQTMEKGHLPWSDFMVHGVNSPLMSCTLFAKGLI